jgi:hypothetical protein
VLVACEYSGTVRRAFRDAGHDAWSCDLLPAEDGSDFHYQTNVMKVIEWEWDLMIAHPPCTYLTIAGAGSYNAPDRQEARDRAINFFKALQSAPVPKIAIENPLPFKTVMAEIGRYHQRINPFEFGDPHRKKICLWLKGLPPLFATQIVDVPPSGYCVRKSGSRAGRKYNYYHHQGKNGHARSRFFPGIAKAMAEQWGDNCGCKYPSGTVAVRSGDCLIHGFEY